MTTKREFPEQVLVDTLRDAEKKFRNDFKNEWLAMLGQYLTNDRFETEEEAFAAWKDSVDEYALKDVGKWSGGMSPTNIAEVWGAEVTRYLARKAIREFERNSLIKQAKEMNGA